MTDELGVREHRVARLARTWGWERNGQAWAFTDEQADRIRAHVRAWDTRGPTECSVEGCDASAAAKGMCHPHYLRVWRHGSTEARTGGEHQRAKTHCPHGHEYTSENTIVFQSDGRRRCRTCRAGAAPPKPAEQ
jgi:hypothetical protein